MDEKERYEKGMTVRSEVLGRDYVERSVANRTEFNGEFQEMLSRHAWGEIWTRPGLPRHTRSLLTIAMMIALNREGELRLHLRASANSGVTREEIKELLLQAAVYCGVPAANSAFHAAQQVFSELDAGNKV
jgi:4-carboxymuconolactone decarboxylase